MEKALAAALPLTLALGCSGEVELRMFGEAYVEEAIPADAFVDGWSVEFSEFVVSVTDVRLSPGGTVAPGAFVVDLARDSSGRGHFLNTTALRGNEVESVHYRLSPPSLSFEGNATEAQAERLRAQNLALWVEGSAARGGQTVRFSWGLPVDLSFDCPVRTPLRSGDKATVELTIQADHLFVDDLEVNPSLAFDEIARADFDEDGSVSPMELGQAPLSGLTRYQTGGREDIDDLWDFVGAASLTMAHVDGEGTCRPRFVPDDHVDREPPTPDPTRAAAVYAEHCASCHGEDGRGGGPLAAGLIPRATDLTSLQGGGPHQPAGRCSRLRLCHVPHRGRGRDVSVQLVHAGVRDDPQRDGTCARRIPRRQPCGRLTASTTLRCCHGVGPGRVTHGTVYPSRSRSPPGRPQHLPATTFPVSGTVPRGAYAEKTDARRHARRRWMRIRSDASPRECGGTRRRCEGQRRTGRGPRTCGSSCSPLRRYSRHLRDLLDPLGYRGRAP